MGANLVCANLVRADLRDANLREAILIDTDLSIANLRGTNLSDAELNGANLSGADLSGADLQHTDLSDTNLSNAYLTGTNLDKVDFNEYTAFLNLQCPAEGSFIGFTKCDKYIVKLQITEDALRSSATSRKCWCSKAKVLSIENLNGAATKILSVGTRYLTFTVGETIEIKNFDTDRWSTKPNGIWFFLNRCEAANC